MEFMRIMKLINTMVTLNKTTSKGNLFHTQEGSIKQPIMEKENLYEVTELQQYDVNSGYEYKDDRKSKEQLFVAGGKFCCTLIVIAVVALMTLFIILILLLVLIVIVEERYASTTVQAVEGMNCPIVYNVSSTTTSLPNCSIAHDEWQQEIKELKTWVRTLLNASEDTAWKIDDIHNFADMQTEKGINNSININKILETTGNSASKLMNIVNTLSNLQDTCTSTAGVADDILLIAQELLVLHNDSTALPTSCKEIKERQPLSPSGVYLLAPTTGGSTYTAYCNMGTLCGSGGGWTRLAYLDMSDATQNCPSGFGLYQSGGVRACSRPSGGGNCASVQFPSNGISYSQICGRVTAYQYGTPDAVNPINNINSYYIDGVSITRGSPRQHVWSLICGVDSQNNHFDNCPCAGGTATQSFIGNDYFCESGNPNTNVQLILYSSDPVWDGEGCGPNEVSCCSVPGIPWFNRTLAAPSSDYVELRQCCDQDISNEDVKVNYYEIYVQ
uniref:Fibrinogen C-terminal domain-containing protein n=2 Tax=Amphimedon queenslandica TaxID=400682 RepID=A0A1X7UBY3_AMPQE